MAWLLKETEFNTFIGKNMVLPSPGEAGEGRGRYLRMKKYPANFFQVEAVHIFVLEYTEGE